MPGADESVSSLGAVLDVLADAREAGFLGPGPVEAQLAHAEGFTNVARGLATGGASPRVLDLGSGGGLPGLVVASAWPECTLVLLEANGRRAGFLRQSIERLGLHARVTVVQERAEAAGRERGYRGGFDGVLARSFGRPAVAAECGAPFLRVGGWLVVSEPPPEPGVSPDGMVTGEGPSPAAGMTTIPGTTTTIAGATTTPGGERWPADTLAQLGLEPVEVVRDGASYQVLRQMVMCPERFPRRDGVPAKRPLF